MVVATLGGALWLTKQGADRAAEASIDKALAATQLAIRDALAGRSQSLLQVTAGLAQVPAYVSRIDEALRAGDRSALVDQVEEFREQTGAAWAMITDDRGVVQAWTLYLDFFDEDFSDASPVQLALAGDSTEGVWIEPADDGDDLYQVVGVPVFDPSKTSVYGVLLTALPIDPAFADELKTHTTSDVAFFALDTLGVPTVAVSTIASDELAPSLRGAEVDWPEYLDAVAMNATADSLGPPRITMPAGNGRLVGVAGPLSNAAGFALGGYVGFRSWETELAAYTQLQDTIAFVFAGAVALALVLSLILAGQITRPVKRLVDLTHRVSEGQYSGSIRVSSRDEIGQLASAFQAMMQELKAKEELVEFLAGGGKTLAITDPGATQIDASAPTIPTGLASQLLAPGMTFASRYQIREVLGAGGMGVVYRAQDLELDEPVAIKTLRPEALQEDSTLMERFRQEIRLARRITHRNVVRTHDIGDAQGLYYITMELVEGETLKHLIAQRGRLPVWVTITVGRQLCRALQVAHEEGIVHRDIKPQNIVVDGTGFLKVMDFGIARLAVRSRDREQGLTAVGAAIGTPDYMAPEQMFGEHVDARADLYAVGGVLFECLTGEPVFSAPTISELMRTAISEPPRDPRSLSPDVPDRLAALVLKALEKSPDDRWSSAEEMLRELDEIKATVVA